MEKNPYLILEVCSHADLKEITAAYRRLARKYHPDINNSPEAVDRMKEINWAYQVLCDPVERASIDRKHKSYRDKWESHYWQSVQSTAKARTYSRARHWSGRSRGKPWPYTRQEPSNDSIRVGESDPVFMLTVIAGIVEVDRRACPDRRLADHSE